MDQLRIIKKILIEATVIICNHLDPKLVLRTMKARGALSPDDCTLIQSKVTRSNQAEEMLNILMTKPATAYETFMDVLLEQKRNDIHQAIKDLEIKHDYVKAGRVLYTLAQNC